MNAPPFERESEQILTALWIVLRRRKLLLTLCLGGVLALVFYYNETTSPVYEASASVVFEELRDPIPDDVSPKLSWELYLFNRIEEINSRAFAEDIAAVLTSESLARFPMPKKTPANYDRMRHICDLLDEGISAYPVRTSNIVRIRVKLSDARLCLLVANLCLSVLEERSSQTRNQGVAKLRVFVEEQLARSATQLATSERNLTKFKETHGITSLVDDSREVLKKMTEAEVLYNSTLADRGAAQKRLAAVKQEIAAQRKDLVPNVTSTAGSSTQVFKDKLMQLEAERVKLSLQKYPDDHPEVVRLQQDIVATRKALADEAMKLAKASDIGDPLPRIERRREESVSLQIEVEGLQARADALERTVDGYRIWIDALPEKEMELARLEREREANQKVYMTLLERREEIRMAEAKQIPGSRVIDRPLLPLKPTEPRKLLNLGLGGTLGLILGFGLGFLMEGRAGRLGSRLEFERQTGWSVLALIPRVRGGPVRWQRGRAGAEAGPRNALVALRDPESMEGESYSMLRTRLELLGVGSKHRSVLVTSCGPRDGKSSTLSNLAAALGAAGRATVVVDAEFRRPTIHSMFGVRRSPGLADLLLSRAGDQNGNPAGEKTGSRAPAEGKGAVTPEEMKVLQETPLRGVAVLASGSQTHEAAQGISWAAMRGVLENLKEKYEVILVDSAPPTLVHETLVLCGMVDAVVVVVDARSYDPERLMEAKHLLEQAGANVVGAVLNKVAPRGRYAYTYGRERARPAS